ncbi:MAG: hypothetical protein JWN51_539, partial [Phycisphaerales bacterium]|nr:hypothetical protein [Phycisphaerales bacterium]
MNCHKARPVSGLLGFSIVILAASFALGGDHFLTIGGGDSPANNQVSLEKNVLFFHRLLTETEGKDVPQDVLFSDGAGKTRDLQMLAPDDPPRINLLLARVFAGESELAFQFRPHDIPGVRGSSTRRGLEEWFNTTGAKLGEDDRLFIYFTGHGGAGNPAQNTTLSMWCERPLTVTDFTKLLDKISPKTQVVLIMVQCHSGGFANVIFKDGKPGPVLSPARRCGFFATTFDRNAAGCTPDTVEEDYKDYSTYFFAALGGKTRTGKRVEGCDLDGDGRVSLAEAHAHVLLHSDTIDIPVMTSDEFLRQFSKVSGESLIAVEAPYNELLEHATPMQRIVLEGLSKELGLTTQGRATEALHLAEILEAQRKTAENETRKRNDERGNLARDIRSRLLRRWPELSNAWHPRVAELMQKEGPEIQHAIESDSAYPRWEIVRREADDFDEKAMVLERRWVKCK